MLQSRNVLAVNDLDRLPSGIGVFTAFAERRRAKIRDRLGNLLEIPDPVSKGGAGALATADG